MENTGYITLTRQSGLMREMRVVANNIANMATTGFRQEGLVFSEFVQRLPSDASLSMATANARMTSATQGALTQTSGQFDFAVEGEGFFQVETPAGPRLTRAGTFTPNAEGDLVTPDGHRVLDAGGAPIFVPPDATDLSVSSDGTISTDGRPVGQIGLFRPAVDYDLIREDGVMFRVEGAIEPTEGGRIVQGFLEGSNVDPVAQIARMIEVQRAYELGQKFLEAEDERIKTVVQTFVR